MLRQRRLKVERAIYRNLIYIFCIQWWINNVGRVFNKVLIKSLTIDNNLLQLRRENGVRYGRHLAAACPHKTAASEICKLRPSRNRDNWMTQPTADLSDPAHRRYTDCWGHVLTWKSHSVWKIHRLLSTPLNCFDLTQLIISWWLEFGAKCNCDLSQWRHRSLSAPPPTLCISFHPNWNVTR